jgi:hypothetical protein
MDKSRIWLSSRRQSRRSTIFHFTQKAVMRCRPRKKASQKGNPKRLRQSRPSGFGSRVHYPELIIAWQAFRSRARPISLHLPAPVPVECGFLSAADINPAWRGPLEMRCQRRDWGKTEKWSATKERASKPLFDRLLRNRPANHVRHVSRHANRQLSRGCHTAGQKHRHPATRLFEITPLFAPFLLGPICQQAPFCRTKPNPK